MINILLPIAGIARRFLEKGYELPKSLIPVDGEPMVKLATDCLLKDVDPKHVKLIFVVRSEHIVNYNIETVLRNIFHDWNIQTIVVDYDTQGTVCSCLLAKELINNSDPLIIYTPDVYYVSDFSVYDFTKTPSMDGLLLTFKANSPDHSYVTLDANGLATKTAEKTVISGDALVGVYCFRKGSMFVKSAEDLVESGQKVKNEFYVSLVYNFLISDGYRIRTRSTSKMYVLGTPDDLEFYTSSVSRYSPVKQFAICCDHSGFELKTTLCKLLQDRGIQFRDFGTHSTGDFDHYDSIKPCIEFLQQNSHTIGIGICHTGQGFNIAANKVKGIRAALVHDSFTAQMARRHNAANFISLAARSITQKQLDEIISAVIEHSFDGGRHATRIRRISNDDLFNP